MPKVTYCFSGVNPSIYIISITWGRDESSHPLDSVQLAVLHHHPTTGNHPLRHSMTLHSLKDVKVTCVLVGFG